MTLHELSTEAARRLVEEMSAALEQGDYDTYRRMVADISGDPGPAAVVIAYLIGRCGPFPAEPS